MKYPVAVVPGVSIGPIALGTTRAEVAALGMKVVPVRALPDSEIVGRYAVHYEEGRVAYVEIDEADARGRITYRGRALAGPGTLEGVAQNFEGCGPKEIHYGGNQIVCRRVSILRGSGWGGVVIRVAAPSRAGPASALPHGFNKLLNKIKGTGQK